MSGCGTLTSSKALRRRESNLFLNTQHVHPAWEGHVVRSFLRYSCSCRENASAPERPPRKVLNAYDRSADPHGNIGRPLSKASAVARENGGAWE